jgi:Na+-transporting NADH:ubiquinone oxidoreductase subunit NqrD
MNSILSNLLSLISIISPCIVFGTSCFFLVKKTSVEAILMTIGSGIGLLITLFYSFLMPLLISAQRLAYTEVSKYYSIVGIISFVASLCFAAGLLILIINTVKKQAVIHNQFPKSTDYNHE